MAVKRNSDSMMAVTGEVASSDFSFGAAATPRDKREPVESLNLNDVLLGRGSGPAEYQGNQRFRSIVEQHKGAYNSATRNETKSCIAEELVEHIHFLGGRFLRLMDESVKTEDCDVEDGTWCEVENEVAVEKVKQALRQGRKRRRREVDRISRRPNYSHSSDQISGLHDDALPIPLAPAVGLSINGCWASNTRSAIIGNVPSFPLLLQAEGLLSPREQILPVLSLNSSRLLLYNSQRFQNSMIQTCLARGQVGSALSIREQEGYHTGSVEGDRALVTYETTSGRCNSAAGMMEEWFRASTWTPDEDEAALALLELG